MSWQAYVRFGVWMALSIAVYCLYSVHSTEGRYAAVEAHTERYKALDLERIWVPRRSRNAWSMGSCHKQDVFAQQLCRWDAVALLACPWTCLLFHGEMACKHALQCSVDTSENSHDALLELLEEQTHNNRMWDVDRPRQGGAEDELDMEGRGLLEMGQLQNRSDDPLAQQCVPVNGVRPKV